MIEDTQVSRPPSNDDTAPVSRPRALEDTQPARRFRRASPGQHPRVYPTPPVSRAITQPAPPRSHSWTRRRRYPYLLLFFVALPLVVAGVAAVGGYVFWQWTAALPRTNVLVLGLDRRPNQGTAVRSDTIILTTVYPAGRRIALLSIPRDLYVEIPGHGTSRINTAHFWGENGAEGSGPALAIETVAHNLGVHADHYVRVDFDGFRAIIEAAGGLDILVEKPIIDNAFPTDDYGTIRIEIPAGLQHMDGDTALQYARSRHGSSDFDRAKRQQQIVVALVQRFFQPEVWPNLPTIYRAVMGNVDTDISALDLMLLAPTFFRAGRDGIEHHVIDREMTTPWTTPTGGAVLLPRWEIIRPLTQELFTP